MKTHLLFPDQRPDEKLILLVRRHWSRVLHFVGGFITGLIVPPIIAGVLWWYDFVSIEEGSVVFVVVVCAASLYYLFLLLYLLKSYIDYHLDIWIVTDQRVINIEQGGLFNRTISSQSIERVQDVTSEVKGKMATFLDYGYVYVQTAAEKERFIFEEVPHPAQIAKIIHDIHDRTVEAEEQEDREALAHTFAQQNVTVTPEKRHDLGHQPPVAPDDQPPHTV